MTDVSGIRLDRMPPCVYQADKERGSIMFDALASTENRALAYAVQSGQAIGGLRTIDSLLKAAIEYPDMQGYYMRRAAEYTAQLLSEVDTI